MFGSFFWSKICGKFTSSSFTLGFFEKDNSKVDGILFIPISVKLFGWICTSLSLKLFTKYNILSIFISESWNSIAKPVKISEFSIISFKILYSEPSISILRNISDFSLHTLNASLKVIDSNLKLPPLPIFFLIKVFPCCLKNL